MKKAQLEKIVKALESEIDAFSGVMDVTKVKQLQKELEKFVTTDALTGALNRWKFEDVLRREMKRSRAISHGLCLAMLDVDSFKKINDVKGHNVGDDILRRISAEIKYHTEGKNGETKRIGRWGGEEFLIIFPFKNIDEASEIAEKVRGVIWNWFYKKELDFPVGVSIGVTHLKKSDTMQTFINRADKAMYRAKKRGGNAVEIRK